MRAMAGVALVLMTGCSAAGLAIAQAEPVPVEARLSREVLTVVMSDGMVCRAAWTGDGPLLPCGLKYAVEPETRPNPLRQAVEQVAGALQAEGLISPMARVVVTDRGGKIWVFEAPPPVAD